MACPVCSAGLLPLIGHARDMESLVLHGALKLVDAEQILQGARTRISVRHDRLSNMLAVIAEEKKAIRPARNESALPAPILPLQLEIDRIRDRFQQLRREFHLAEKIRAWREIHKEDRKKNRSAEC